MPSGVSETDAANKMGLLVIGKLQEYIYYGLDCLLWGSKKG